MSETPIYERSDRSRYQKPKNTARWYRCTCGRWWGKNKHFRCWCGELPPSQTRDVRPAT